jgi:hypothetical protein
MNPTNLASIRSLRIGAVASLMVLLPSTSNAQLPSVIQLPSFSSISYNGTVVVPDSGAGYRGGVKRSASSHSRRGLHRSSGRALGNSGAMVTPTIIDLHEMDRRMLSGSPKEFTDRHSSRSVSGTNRTKEGKSLVRYARRQYQRGDKYGAAYSYRLAISILDGRLRRLAIAEYRRLY